LYSPDTIPSIGKSKTERNYEQVNSQSSKIAKESDGLDSNSICWVREQLQIVNGWLGFAWSDEKRQRPAIQCSLIPFGIGENLYYIMQGDNRTDRCGGCWDH